jgi:hypothetical protein
MDSTIPSSFRIASPLETRYRIGSILCFSSPLCVETQFGDFGQGASRPSVTPSLEDFEAEQATSTIGTARIHNNIDFIAVPFN